MTSNMRSTREQIIETRKATNIPPHKQRVTRRNDFYRSARQLVEDQAELLALIEQARLERTSC